jgi:YVTN family beta-propeller protein
MIGGCTKAPGPVDEDLARPDRPVAREDAPASPVEYGPVLFEKKVVKEGLNVEFSMRLVRPDARERAAVREGDDVLFRFKLTDKDGAPVTRAYPAAWLDLKADGEGETDPRNAARKVEKLIGGGLFSRPELDLNAYYVLALNEDPTITVVDPLFGFGGTKLLAIVKLRSPGSDWAITENQRTVFVSLPAAKQVAVMDTSTWKVDARVTLPSGPVRLALQPDQRYLWAACSDDQSASHAGIQALAVDDRNVVAEIPTGSGPHDLAVSDDSAWVFATNGGDGTLSVIDARKLRLQDTIETGRRPASVAYSSMARMAYVTHEDGTIAVVDPERRRVIARMKVEPGLGQIRFAPGGRYAMAVNPSANLVHVVDASRNRVVQAGKTREGPDKVAFSDGLAYIRHLGSETVLIFPLKRVGLDGEPLSVLEFSGGQSPPAALASPSPADAIVQAAGESAVLVANPADRAIYFYKEGMAAPMGHFNNYGHLPRAVLCVNRSLRERTSPGVYETVAKVQTPGRYDAIFYLDSPRIAHCFDMNVEADPTSQLKRNAGKVTVELVGEAPALKVGKVAALRFRIVGKDDRQPKVGLKDVAVLTFLAPGPWNKRHPASEQGDGIYGIEFTPPRPGIFYVNLESSSAGLTLSDPHTIILRCAENDAEPRENEPPNTGRSAR